MNALIVATFLTFSQIGAITCIEDPTDKESSNAFLVEGGQDSLLVDAGWGDQAEVPVELEKKIQDARWDRVAQTHGACYATRQDVEKAAASLQDVEGGKVDHEWNFSFMVPLWK